MILRDCFYLSSRKRIYYSVWFSSGYIGTMYNNVSTTGVIANKYNNIRS